MQYNNMNVPGQNEGTQGDGAPPLQNNTPPPTSGGGHNKKILFIGIGVVAVLVGVIASLLVVVLTDKDTKEKYSSRAEIREALVGTPSADYAEESRPISSLQRRSALHSVAEALVMYYVEEGNNRKYPVPSSSAVAYRCYAGEASGGLKDLLSQYLDYEIYYEFRDLLWDDIIYGVDDLNNPQTYVLGIRGFVDSYSALEDDLDFGSQIYERYAIASSPGGTPSVGAWDCDCGSADELDSVYCETNRRM